VASCLKTALAVLISFLMTSCGPGGTQGSVPTPISDIQATVTVQGHVDTTETSTPQLAEQSEVILRVSGNSDDSVFAEYNFPAYPATTHQCQQQVYGQDGEHLTLDALTTHDPPGTVRDYYREQLGETGYARDGDGGTWRLPPEQPKRVLKILPAHAGEPFPQCEKTMPRSAKSVIILSRLYVP
jgi:hypothetical protein